MSKKEASYWINKKDRVPVHYFHGDSDLTIGEIFEDYADWPDGDPQVHVIVISKRDGRKPDLEGEPR